jgi:antitoxin component YwqK of YwqJK toxin-antitoxin module
MRILIFLFSFAICLQASAQKIEKYYDYLWKETESSSARFYSQVNYTDSGWQRTDYFLNPSKAQMVGLYEDKDCKIANGTFYYFYPNGNLEYSGKYIHGKKEGLWLSYHYNGILSDSAVYKNNFRIGTSLSWYSNGYLSDSSVHNNDSSGISLSWFDNGNISSAGYLAEGNKPNGKWQFFHKNGKLASLETYDHGKLIDKKYYDENGNSVTDTTDKNHSPQFMKSNKAWQDYLSKKVYFPDSYKITNSDFVVVMVTFSIDEEGNILDAYVSVPFNPAFDDIALKAIKDSPKWTPAKAHNRSVSYTYAQPVTFSQEEE